MMFSDVFEGRFQSKYLLNICGFMYGALNIDGDNNMWTNTSALDFA